MSDPTAAPWIAVPAAVLSAVSFGLAQALQHRAARRVKGTETIRFGLIAELSRQRVWIGSLFANGAGVALQWLALSTSPLVLVQPLLVSALLFAVLISAGLNRQRPDRTVLAGTLLCGAGLASFIMLASPKPGGGDLYAWDVPPLAAGLAAILSACIVVGIRHPGPVRALSLATATGVFYGVTAGLTKLAVSDLGAGLVTMLTNWPIYLVAVCGPLGFVLNQNAFRVGEALAPTLAVIIGLQPLVSIGIGVVWLEEQVRGTPFAILGEFLAFGVLLTGVVVLSRRHPQATLGDGGTPDPGGSGTQRGSADTQ